MKSEFRGIIQVDEEENIKWFNVEKIREFLKGHAGERFEFVIKKYRTKKQNAYLHVLIGILAEHLGYEENEMKDIVKKEFLTIEVASEKTGIILSRVKDTRELSKDEMMDLIDRLKRWSAIEFNCYLPDAGEEMKMSF